MPGLRLTIFLATLLSSSGCYSSYERDIDAGPRPDAPTPDTRSADAPPTPPAPPLVWAVVHPTTAPMGPGLFLYDETTSTILRHLPLPPGVTSPHALAWDGTSLWMSDLGDIEHPTVYELSPDDGSVRSSFTSMFQTEGIAVDGADFWYSTTAFPALLVRVTRTGMPLQSIRTEDNTVQDLVLANGALYYLINDDVDRIFRVDRATGALTELVRGVHIAPYSLGFDGTALAVAVDGTILRFDPTSGRPLSTRPFGVPGWITAIAFVR